MRFVIREPTPEELPALAELWTQAYVDNLLKIPMSRADAEAVADQGVRQVVLKAADYKDLVLHVAEDTDAKTVAAGLAIYLNARARASYGIYMWVREEYRGRALFTRNLFRYTEKVLLERGANRVEFGVLMSNPRALRIYELLGYKPYAVTMVKRLVPVTDAE